MDNLDIEAVRARLGEFRDISSRAGPLKIAYEALDELKAARTTITDLCNETRTYRERIAELEAKVEE